MSFLTGFVTGLAGSIDKQVQKSVERTRDNIDMVSKWRLKKAEEREKERKQKDEEIKTLIQDAAYTIGGSRSDVDAQNLAASLYKEQGLSGFTDTLSFIKKQKEKGIAVNPLQYFTRASADLPEDKYTQSQIVRSLSDAENSYVSKTDLFPGELKGSGLIKTLVPDFDVAAAGDEKATKQMDAIGFKVVDSAPSLNFGQYTFDREGMSYATMSVNEKTSYLRDTINNTSSTPGMISSARNRLDDLLNQSMTGEESSALNAINLQLSLLGTKNTKAMSEQDYATHDAEIEDLVKRRDELQDTINLRDAKTTKDKLLVQAEIARRDGNIEESVELTNKAQDLGGNVTFNTYKTRIDSRMARNMNNDDYLNSVGSFEGKGYKEDIAHKNAVTAMENKSKDMNFDAAVAFKNNIQKDTLAEFKIKHPDVFKELGLSSIPTDDANYSDKVVAAITGASADSAVKFKAIQTEVIERYKQVGLKANVAPSTLEGAVMLLTGEGISLTPAATSGAVSDTTAVTVDTLGDQTDALDPNFTPVAEPAAVKLTTDQIGVLKTEFPDTPEGALEFYTEAQKAGDTDEQTIAIAKQIHGDDFAEKLIVHTTDAQNTAMQMLQDADALTGGNPFISRDVVGINRPKSRKVAAQLAQELNISVANANLLIDTAVTKRNSSLTFAADQLNSDNIAAVLEREGFGNSYASLPAGRKRLAVEAIATAFSIDKDAARESLNSYGQTGNTATPVEPATAVSDNSTESKTNVADMTNNELRQVISAEESSNTAVTNATNELIDRTRLSTADDNKPVVEKPAEEKPSTNENSLVQRRTEADRYKDLRDTEVTDMTTQFPTELKVRYIPDESLIGKYLSNPKDLNQDEVAEIRRRLNDESDFVDAMSSAIANKKERDAELAKRSNQQTTRIQGQGLMARGGLVG